MSIGDSPRVDVWIKPKLRYDRASVEEGEKEDSGRLRRGDHVSFVTSCPLLLSRKWRRARMCVSRSTARVMKSAAGWYRKE